MKRLSERRGAQMGVDMKKLIGSGRGKIICAAVSIALVLGTALGVTLAYYRISSNQAVNQFAVGNVTTELVEDFHQDSDTEFTKTPRVTNTGSGACLVRIRMSVTPEDVERKYVLDEAGQETGTPYLEIGGRSSKWILREDGYYYYEEVLQPGESTEPLFTTVTVNYDEDRNPWVDFDIVLYHEAVQAQVTADGEVITDPDAVWSMYKQLQ